MRLSFPLKIEFEITSMCNLKCKHCMLNLTPKNELDKQSICDLIDDWVDNGLLELQLTGGEPLLRNDITDIIKYARSKGLKVLVSTNGTLITEELSECLANSGAFIEISLDGSCARIHDSIRGSGSFDKTITGIRVLKHYNNKIMIETVIQKDNYKDLENICELSYSLGAYRHLFHNLRIAKSCLLPLRLDRDEMIEAQRRVFALRNNYNMQIQPPYLPVDKYFEQKEKSLFDNKVFGCGALKFKCGVTSNGDMYPCLLFSGIEEFKLGNVHSDSVKEMWNSDKATNIYKMFNSKMPMNCEKCSAKNECDYGCRKVSYTFNSNCIEQDISCPYSKEFV